MECVGFEFDSSTFCEYLESLSEVYLLEEHEHREWSSSLICRKTIRNLFCGRDDERWCFFGLERRESFPIRSRLLELDILTYELDYIDAGFYVGDERIIHRLFGNRER